MANAQDGQEGRTAVALQDKMITQSIVEAFRATVERKAEVRWRAQAADPNAPLKLENSLKES